MKNPIKTFMLLFIIPAILILSSCKNDKDSNQDMTSSEKDTIENNVATGGTMTSGNSGSSNGASSMNNTAAKTTTTSSSAASEMVYKMTDVDRIAIFDNKCLSSENPVQCSSDKLASYVKANVKYPKKDLSRGNEGYEVITFTINKDGSLGKTKYVTSKGKECKECQEEAMKVFDKMGSWVPAQKNGANVSCEMVLPIRFGIASN